MCVSLSKQLLHETWYIINYNSSCNRKTQQDEDKVMLQYV